MPGDPFENRAYRSLHGGHGLIYFRATIAQSDLHIGARRALPERALAALEDARAQVQGAILSDARFLHSLAPVPAQPSFMPLACDMCAAAEAAGVGPMAAVAGAIAQFVGRALLGFTDQVIVENGGDIFLVSSEPRTVAIAAPGSAISQRLGLRLPAYPKGLGVCTSSGTVGHSLSLGRADAVVIVSPDAALADAAATAVGNTVKSGADVRAAARYALKIPRVTGALVLCEGQIAAAGDIELVAIRG